MQIKEHYKTGFTNKDSIREQNLKISTLILCSGFKKKNNEM